MKNYYIRADLGDGIPSYDFVVKAENLDDAIKQGGAILRQDYPEEYRDRENDFYCCHITAEQLLKRLTID